MITLSFKFGFWYKHHVLSVSDHYKNMPASLYWCLEPYQVNKIPTASTSLSESDFMNAP